MRRCVGQDGILRPIANRPSYGDVQLTAAPIDNRPQDSILPHKLSRVPRPSGGLSLFRFIATREIRLVLPVFLIVGCLRAHKYRLSSRFGGKPIADKLDLTDPTPIK